MFATKAMIVPVTIHATQYKLHELPQKTKATDRRAYYHRKRAITAVLVALFGGLISLVLSA